jgi:hypothetical protein
MDQTLQDYINRITQQENKKNSAEKENNFNDYKVYPEDDGYDTPKNPYSPV